MSTDMSKSKSHDESSIIIIKPNEVIYPYKIGFNRIDIDEINYINSIIVCLSNLSSLNEKILKSGPDNDYINLISSLAAKDNSYDEKIGNLRSDIVDYNSRGKNKPERNEKIIFITIKYLLENYITKIQGTCDLIYEKYKKTCTICKTIDSYEDINIKFNFQNIIQQNLSKLEETKKITIEDCFTYYFNQIKNEKFNLSCKKCKKIQEHQLKLDKLPEILFCFLEYGQNFKYGYSIKEEIYLEDIKKKYILSSFIVCEQFGEVHELYYSIVKDNSNYILYDGLKILENVNITGILEKDKIDVGEQIPFLLIYTEYNDNN